MEVATLCGFWVCLALLAYSYVIYPIVLFLIYSFHQVVRDVRYLRGRHDRRARMTPSREAPRVSLIIAAYNEEAVLPAKVENLRQIDYPRSRLEIIFVSDGSNDRTNAILGRQTDPAIRTIFLPERCGKAHALNRGVAAAACDILVFSDASTLLAPDAIHTIVRHFADPRVGAVCGAVQFERSAESRQTEGIYWGYESMLRLMEGRIGATLTASGALHAVRRECYRPLPPGTILDDFLIPVNARNLGYAVRYDPEATAVDFGPGSVRGEFARRVRIAVGSFQALPSLLRARMSGGTFLALLSHKVLRWIAPFLFLGVLLSSGLLLGHLFYRVVFFGQIAFYLWALGGAVFRAQFVHVRYALIAYFVVAMNAALVVGLIRAIRGLREVAWQRID